MPNPQNRTGRDFSMYEAMNDEQLRQILRDDASKIEGEDTDMELMLHIMEVLAKRRREANENISPEEALERFNEKYKYTDNSLISEVRPAKKKTLSLSRWQRWVATIAAVLILVFGSALTAQAFGFDVFEIIAKWTKETFHFGYVNQSGDSNEPQKNDELISTELQKTLTDYGVELALAPTWIPDGYTEGEVRVMESPAQRFFIASYENGEKVIRMRIANYLDDYPSQIEQSDSLLECYTYDGIDFYIFENLDQLRAVWIVENYECYIMGPLTLDEIKAMIDSIEKG